jgi:hypothetical protein
MRLAERVFVLRMGVIAPGASAMIVPTYASARRQLCGGGFHGRGFCGGFHGTRLRALRFAGYREVEDP